MLDNEHHAEELVGVAKKLGEQGFAEAAAAIAEAVEDFRAGNAKLDKALSILKK